MRPPHALMVIAIISGIVVEQPIIWIPLAIFYLLHIAGVDEVMANATKEPATRMAAKVGLLPAPKIQQQPEAPKVPACAGMGAVSQPARNGNGRFQTRNGTKPETAVDALAEFDKVTANETAAPSVLDVMKRQVSVLVIGSSGSGKTTLLRHMVHDYKNVLICDPHYAPGKWPAGARVVGAGMDYESIEQALQRVALLMQQRYAQMARGEVEEGRFSPLAVIIDEGRSVIRHAENVGTIFIDLLTQARKVGITVIMANHSQLVSALGLQGASDLREGLALVHLQLRDGVRSATVNYGDGEIAVSLPGPLPGNGKQETVKPETAVSPPVGNGKQRETAVSHSNGKRPFPGRADSETDEDYIEHLKRYRRYDESEDAYISRLVSGGVAWRWIARAVGGRMADTLDRIRTIAANEVTQ